MPEKHSSSLIEKTVAVALLLLLIFASPILDWWSRLDLPWYAPYLFWLVVITLTALSRKDKRKDDV